MTNELQAQPETSTEFAEAMLQVVPNLALIGLTDNGSVRTWNETAVNMFGYTAAEAIGRHWSELSRQGAEQTALMMTQAQEHGCDIEGSQSKKDGTHFRARTQVKPLRRDGRIFGYGLIITNLSGHRVASEKLYQAEQVFNLMVSEVKDYAIFLMDQQGNIRTWNEGAQRILGYLDAEIIGRNFTSFYPRESQDSKHPQNELRLALADGRYQEEGWRVRKNGQHFWSLVTITPVKDESGIHTGFVKVTRDLTERGIASRDLKLSEETFRLMVSSVKDYAIFMLDPSGFIATWNEGAERIKGYSKEEILGKHFSIFYTDEHRQQHHPEFELKSATQSGQYEEEDWRVRKDGTRFWASVTITALRAENGDLKGFVKVTRDLTDRKTVEQELKGARDQAIQASRLKSEFVANVSHEIRTPMAGIIGMAEQLVIDDTLNADQREAAEHVFLSSRRLLDVLNDLLDFTKLEAGKVCVDEHEFSLKALLEEVVDSVRQPARKKNLTVISTFDERLPDKVIGDSSKILQVLLNLAHNAVKFTKLGSVSIAMDEESSTANEHEVTFRVVDTGIGVKEESRAMLFQPFVQGDGSTRRRFGGTGLGLSICKKNVELLSGTIGFSSQSGQGSTFWFKLPLKRAAQ